ncbi:hypothetical protein CDD83_5678 [Cordyceps sp. RAO-2017]|nr:hypothetical protein CDD83_5678 [Cordyceps sp. RAO-2017]
MVAPTMVPVLGEVESWGGAEAPSRVTEVVAVEAEERLESEAEADESGEPMTTGVGRGVGVAVRWTVTRRRSRASRPGAVVATMVARLEMEPQPYW